MRTDLANKTQSVEEKTKAVVATDDKTSRGIRRSLQPLQVAAGDKENLVGGGRILQMPPHKEKLTTLTEKPSKKLKPAKDEKIIIAEDLTCEAGPSENYWEVLAEKRRVALEEALEENKHLYARISLLEEENAQCKIVIDDTKSLVETLTEMLQGEKESADEDKDGKESADEDEGGKESADEEEDEQESLYEDEESEDSFL